MFLDLGMGLIIAVVLSAVFNSELSVATIILSGLFSLLPDIDVPVEILQRGKLGGKTAGFHQELTHFPLLHLFLAIAILALSGKFLALLYFLCIFSHLLHDSIWTGWGIKWLWPISHKRYKFLANQETGEFSLNPVASWDPETVKSKMHGYGDDEWFKNLYLRLSPVLIVELLVFLAALLLLFLLTGKAIPAFP